MRFAVVFLFIFVAAFEPEERARIVEECSKDSKVDVGKLGDQNYLDEMKIDRDFQCFTKCVVVKLGFVNDAGVLNEWIIKRQLQSRPITDDKYKKIKACSDKQTQEDMCERISNITDCVYMKHEEK